MARRIEDAAIVMAAAAIPRGAHARPAVWGVPPDCPDPPRCGRSPFCPGDRPGCLDPAPFNPLGRIILAPGKIPVRAVGRHERPEREGTDDNDST
jgi:hypothetical protein